MTTGRVKLAWVGTLKMMYLEVIMLYCWPIILLMLMMMMRRRRRGTSQYVVASKDGKKLVEGLDQNNIYDNDGHDQ